MRKRHAFTLIELLIVVAIIAILAAIAVPNFLEAQTRSRVSRVKADFRSYATALESYYVENNMYPLDFPGPDVLGKMTENLVRYNLYGLTTPIAFMSSLSWRDPFRPESIYMVSLFENGNPAGNRQGSLMYLTVQKGTSEDSTWGRRVMRDGGTTADYLRPNWLLQSTGPDGREAGLAGWLLNGVTGDYWPIYDPTNGTVSSGDIARAGGVTTIANTGQIMSMMNR